MNTPAIQFKPSKKQFEAYQRLTDASTSFVGYGGSAFSGKSYLLCYWLTIMCIAYPGTGWGLGRKQITTLKKTTLITLFKVFGECSIFPGVHYNYNQQSNEINFWNGSTIFLIDTEYRPSDPLFTRFGGLELTGAAVDESAETTKGAIQILSTRLGRRMNEVYGLAAKLLETFNPDKGHVYQRYYRPWKDGLLTADYAFIRALPSDNPSPEVPAYIARIRATGDKVTIERLIEGNFEYDDDPQKIFEYDKILALFTNDHVPLSSRRYLTADIAYEGSDKFVIGVWNGYVLSYVEAIDKINQTDVSRKIHDLRMKWQVPIGNVIYDADGLKLFVRHSAKEGNLQGAVQFHNGGKALYNENFGNLKTQCYFKLAAMAANNEIYIQDKKYITEIIEELDQIKKRVQQDSEPIKVEKKEELRVRLGRSPDFADMIMMRMLPELKPKGVSLTDVAGFFG